MPSTKSSKRVFLTLPTALVRDLDEQAAREFKTKSEFVKAAIVDRLQPHRNEKARSFVPVEEAE